MSKHQTTKQTEPDAWMRLVLSKMGVDELRKEIAEAQGDELRWLQDELRRKEAK